MQLKNDSNLETFATNNITKIETPPPKKKKKKKKKTLNNTSLTEHKTDINITKNNKYKKTGQQFYDGTQNRTQIHFGEPGNKHTQIN